MDGVFVFLAFLIALLFVVGLDSLIGQSLGKWWGGLAVVLLFIVFAVVAFGFQSLGLISSPG
jgi:hypothetical protein